MFKYIELWVTLIIIFMLSSCGNSNDPYEIDNFDQHETYKPGEIVVGLQDTVDSKFINSVINNLNLKTIKISADSSFSMWCQVDSGIVENHIITLENDTAVAWADRRGCSQCNDQRKEHILIHFFGFIDTIYARSLISTNTGLSWESTIFPPRHAVIGVPVGKEEYWINIFKSYSFVRYAELNHIAYLFD